MDLRESQRRADVAWGEPAEFAAAYERCPQKG
jgi:hypothetical protein